MSAPQAFFPSFFWVRRDDSLYTFPSFTIYSHALRKFRAPIAITAISLIAAQILKKPLYYKIFACSAAYLTTKLVRKLFSNYDLLHKFEDFGIKIIRRLPYIQIFITIIAFAFFWYLPEFSTAAACTMGATGGITQENYSTNAYYEEQQVELV